MNVETLALGEFQTNSYIVWKDGGKSALVIDCPEPHGPIVDRLNELGLIPEIVVNTHAHVDHIAGNPGLRKAFPDLKLAASAKVSELLGRPSMNLTLFFGKGLTLRPADIMLEDGGELEAGGGSFEIIQVEGHAPGSICLLRKGKPGVVFTGDTLFAGSVGRTDLPGGDTEALISGIRSRILCLNEDTIVYPGHGPVTTIGAEKDNPFL